MFDGLNKAIFWVNDWYRNSGLHPTAVARPMVMMHPADVEMMKSSVTVTRNIPIIASSKDTTRVEVKTGRK